MLSTEEMISKIAESTGKTEEEIKNKIEEQKKSMPGISEHGVIRLVAKEMGVNLFRPEPQELKIGNILPNMRDITFIGKATVVQPPREFQRGDSMGKVQNIFIEDETGKIRMSLWNDEVEKYDIKLGDVLKVEKARIRKDNFGNLEARLGYSGTISKLEKDIDVQIKEPKNSLLGIEDGDEVDIEATLIQIFERPLVYQFCPQCRTRVIGNICFTHGSIQPDKLLIITGVIDDGNVSGRKAYFQKCYRSRRTTKDTEHNRFHKFIKCLWKIQILWASKKK